MLPTFDIKALKTAYGSILKEHWQHRASRNQKKKKKTTPFFVAGGWQMWTRVFRQWIFFENFGFFQGK